MEKPELVAGKVDWKGKAAVKNKHGGARTALLMLVTFGFENILALAVNLVTYFSGVMHLELADAANQLTNFLGAMHILTILAALLVDAYTGRFRAVLIAGFLEFAGFAALTLQAHYPRLKPPPCNIFDQASRCAKIGGGNAVVLYVALYLLAAGSAGVKAALPSHGADQFDEKRPKRSEANVQLLHLPLLAVCVGGAVSFTLIVWIQDKRGWDRGFGISSIAILLAVIIFSTGLPLYRIQIIQRTSSIISIMQVCVAAIRNRNLHLPEDHTELYEIHKYKEATVEAEFLPHRDVFRFLDKAAIQPTSTWQDGRAEAANPWKLCRVTQVENAKILLGMVPIFGCTIIMTLCLAQLQTFSVHQGLTMNTYLTKSLHIPPATLPIIPIVFMIIIIPFYDQIFVPFARKFTGIPTGITHLQRVGVGLILSSMSMAVAATIEVKRKGVARDHSMLDAIPVVQPLPISTLWLSFQYFIFGIADLFTYIGLLEFFYSEAPKGLKSFSSCFLWSSMALGYFFSTILVKIVNGATKNVTRSTGGWLAGNNINRNHLNLFYWLLSIVSLINFSIYLFVAKRYKYRPQNPVESNENSTKA